MPWGVVWVPPPPRGRLRLTGKDGPGWGIACRVCRGDWCRSGSVRGGGSAWSGRLPLPLCRDGVSGCLRRVELARDV